MALTGFLVWRQWFETYHLVVVDEGKLYRDGNRSLREFKNTLRKSGARTVIAVLDEKEFGEPEFIAARELVKSRGLEFHWIPIPAGWYPTDAQVKEFLQIASDPAKPIPVTSVGYELNATARADGVHLAWNPRNDEGYRGAHVYREGAISRSEIGFVDGASFVDAGAKPGSRVRYTVVLERSDGTLAPPSSPVEIQLPAP